MKTEPINIFWFRRDLRLFDNAGLYHALKTGKTLPIFIFDKTILSHLEEKDPRVEFILKTILKLKEKLESKGSTIRIYHSTPKEAFSEILKVYQISQVFFNHDYEPQAVKRDLEITNFLESKNIKVSSFKDQVIFEKSEVLTDQGKPYSVFTPYSRKWKSKLNNFYLKSYPTEHYNKNFSPHEPTESITLEQLGFIPSGIKIPASKPNVELIKKYDQTRNFPAINGTSLLGVHFRFGTISIREYARLAYVTNQTWLSELIWRDFFMQILHHYPHSAQKSFRPEYDNIKWENNPKLIELWKNGQTGVPLVDAGMRELNATGHMHNRVRMVVASYLCKNLHCDWRIGERYFASKLLDFDLSANIGNWQWAAGSGCDAAPYFRVFNPELQADKFDPTKEYITKWVKEYGTAEYKPKIDFKSSRAKCLIMYHKALKK